MIRKTHFAQTKAQKQADWLARFADTLLSQHPRLAGRVDWDAAKHYYFRGVSATEAVSRYCLARNIGGHA